MNTPLFLLFCLALLPAASGCWGLNEKEGIAMEGYKHNSKAYYNNGMYAEAAGQCYKGLDLDSGDYSLNLTLGWCLLRLGDRQSLFAAFSQFKTTDGLKWFNEDFRIQLGLGQTSYKIATLYRKQMNVLERKISEDPASGELFREELEECRVGWNEHIEMAMDYLRQTLAHERQRDNIEAILTLGEIYAYQNQDGQAVEYLTRGLELLEKSTSFQSDRLDNDPSMTSDGERFFDRQIRRNLKWEAELRGVLAMVFRRMGDLERALAQYDLLKERDLFNEFQHYNRAILLQKLGRYPEAIEEYNLYLSRVSVQNTAFDEDEHFHIAFENIEECKRLMEARGGDVGKSENTP